MKVYVLTSIRVGNENNITVGTDLYFTREDARTEMRKQIELLHKANREKTKNERENCSAGSDKVQIRSGSGVMVWEIKEKELPVEMVIHLHGGLVQSVYCTADICPEIYDTDSEDPDLEDEIKRMQVRLNELDADPAWIEVY